MIISASRRTDIPAFFSEWFINRIRERYCCTVNPFNKNQVSRVSLDPHDVDAIVFWTKDAEPITKYLDELDERGYKYYFQYTLTGYSKVWEPNIPNLGQSVETFINLSRKIGNQKVIWRYDPIIFSNVTDYDYHYKNFIKLVNLLKGSTARVVISILDDYRGSRGRINELQKIGIKLIDEPTYNDSFKNLMRDMHSYAGQNGIEMFSCAEPIDLREYGIMHGKCIDDNYIKKVFNIDVNHAKDRNQRKECGCVESKDIGAYDTCLHGCKYCYANRSQIIVEKNHKEHMVNSPSLLGWHECARQAWSSNVLYPH